jgi:hypothetical protein
LELASIAMFFRVPRRFSPPAARAALAAFAFCATGWGARPASAEAVAPPPRGGLAAVRFDPDEPGLRLLSLTGVGPIARVVGFDGEWWVAGYGPIYQRVCDGPCMARFEPGAYRLALAKGGRVVPAGGPAVIDGPATLHAHFEDRSGLRTAGTVIGVVGVVGGIVMIVASTTTHQGCNVYGYCVWSQSIEAPLFAVGAGVVVASVLVGSILGAQPDEARITIEPLALPTGRASREAPVAGSMGRVPAGAAIAIHF